MSLQEEMKDKLIFYQIIKIIRTKLKTIRIKIGSTLLLRSRDSWLICTIRNEEV